MDFDTDKFNKEFPGIEGQILARKILLDSARFYCNCGRTIYEWEQFVNKNPDLRHFVTLLGGPKILDHISWFIWHPIKG